MARTAFDRLSRAFFAVSLLCCACGGWRGTTYKPRRNDEAAYRFGTPGPDWQAARKLKEVQVAWVNRRLGAVIELHAMCEEHGDSSLHQFTDHLRIDWTDWKVVSEREFKLIGRDALETVVVAELDGVPRKLDLIVVKKSGCLFDLRYSARPDAFDAGRAAFAEVVAGFDYPIGS